MFSTANTTGSRHDTAMFAAALNSAEFASRPPITHSVTLTFAGQRLRVGIAEREQG
jgi:hypothetical protein